MEYKNKKYFRFYLEYKKPFQLLSKRQQLKLLYMLLDYTDTGTLPAKGSKKTITVFYKLMKIIDTDEINEALRIEKEKNEKRLKEERKKAGKKGAVRRWKRHYGTHDEAAKMAKNSKVMAKNSKTIAKNTPPTDIFTK